MQKCATIIIPSFEDELSPHLQDDTFENPKAVKCVSIVNTARSFVAEEAPTAIYAIYSTDLNIVKIHEAVIARFTCLNASIPLLERHLAAERAFASKTIGTIVDRRNVQEKAARLENQIKSLRSGSSWNEYVVAARPLLEKYVKMSDVGRIEGRVPHCDPITQSGLLSSANFVVARERIMVIRRYIEIASKYIEINAHMIPVDASECLACGRPRSGDGHASEYGTQVCECGCETVGIACSSTFRDSSRIDLGTRNGYIDLVNFVRRIDAYEGIQKTRPPSMLYTQLDAYFTSNGLTPPSDTIRAMAHLPNGKKPETSIALLEQGLVATNNSAYYRDLELIAHNLWGWKLADLTTCGLRNRIIKDYAETQRVYQEVKERDSSLNVNLRLYFHLCARDYPCEIEDFKTVSSPESIDYHRRMISIMCERTGLKYVEIE